MRAGFPGTRRDFPRADFLRSRRRRFLSRFLPEADENFFWAQALVALAGVDGTRVKRGAKAEKSLEFLGHEKRAEISTSLKLDNATLGSKGNKVRQIVSSVSCDLFCICSFEFL